MSKIHNDSHKNVNFRKTSLFISYKYQYLTDILAKRNFQIQQLGFSFFPVATTRT